MTRAFARKDFLTLVGGTGLLSVLGCAAEDPAPGDPVGGAGGMAGGAGSSGTSGTAGGGAAGTGGTAGTAGTGGSAGTGGTSGASGAGGAQGGSAGSQAGGGAGGSGAGGGGAGQGGAGSGGVSGGGQAGTAGNAGGAGAGQGGTAGNAGTFGGGNGGSAGGGNACDGDIEAEISLNHMHALTVPMADIMAGVAKVYDTKGAAAHSHYVELTADDFATLRSGGTIKKLSCNGGDHEYVLSCGTASETAEDPGCAMSDNCGNLMNMLCPDPT